MSISHFISKSPMHHLLIISLVFSLASAQKASTFQEVRPPQRFALSTSSPYFQVDFTSRQAFRSEINSFNGDKVNHGFCKVFPSQISAELEYNGNIEDEDNAYYDNIIYYEGFYFILDSLNFNILVTRDVQEFDFEHTITSHFQNQVDENGDYDEPFLSIDTVHGVLYIITSSHLYSYELSFFMNAMKTSDEIPAIGKSTPHFKTYESVLYTIHHRDLLFIVADNTVDVFTTDKSGKVAHFESLDAKFFGAKDVSIVDMAVSEHFAFILDKLEGLYIVEITNGKGKDRLKYRDDLNQIKLSNGQFVEVIGRSVNVISSTTKSHSIKEYIIKGDPKNIKGFEFNRKIDLFESVRNTYSDSNFLYILTGSFNMVLKHSIPSEFDPAKGEEDYLYQYWPVFGIKTMVTVTEGLVSQAVTLQDDTITTFTFSEDNPYITCNLTRVEAGIYTYVINSLQTTCDQKKESESEDFHEICQIEELVELIVPKDPSMIGNLQQRNQTLVILLTGVLSAIILSCIILYVAMKYRKRYNILEDQIKFHQLSQSVVENTKEDQSNTEREDAEMQVVTTGNVLPVANKEDGEEEKAEE